MTKPSTPAIETHPLTPGRWRDFSELFNTVATTRHCWCIWPRIATDYRTQSDARNKRSFKKVVDTAEAPPGVLGYVDGVPSGWCAVAPRDDYGRLARSRATAPFDQEPVWSVVCFFVRRGMRGRGLSETLLSAAVELAAQHGAKIVEGYPIEGSGDPFHGVASVFESRRVQGSRTPHPEPPVYACPHQARAQAGAGLILMAFVPPRSPRACRSVG